MFSLSDDEARRGVVTHSSGNHGAALAYAARARGIPAWVVMPENAPKVKQENVRRFGATIRFCAPTVAAREAACADVQRDTGATLIHPFDDARVIAGQGTAALELLEDVPDLDIVIAPGRRRRPAVRNRIAARVDPAAIRVYGAEPANADDAARSFRSGRVEPLPRRRRRSPTDCARRSRARTLAAMRAHVAAIGTRERGCNRARRCG